MNTTPTIQPIVLVGGRSSRFGRDKLREPVSPGSTAFRAVSKQDARLGEPRYQRILVDCPIAVLREVFGKRVAIVGDCHASIPMRADLVIADRYPDVGPIGGIVSALETHDGDVFVLPGDLPWITADVVRAMLDEAMQHPRAMAVLGRTQQIEPCVGIYRQAALPLLQHRLASGRRSLHDAIPPECLSTVHVSHAALINVNTPDALQQGQAGSVP